MARAPAGPILRAAEPDDAPAISLHERFGFAREGLMRPRSCRAGRCAGRSLMARPRGLP